MFPDKIPEQNNLQVNYGIALLYILYDNREKLLCCNCNFRENFNKTSKSYGSCNRVSVSALLSNEYFWYYWKKWLGIGLHDIVPYEFQFLQGFFVIQNRRIIKSIHRAFLKRCYLYILKYVTWKDYIPAGIWNVNTVSLQCNRRGYLLPLKGTVFSNSKEIILNQKKGFNVALFLKGTFLLVVL